MSTPAVLRSVPVPALVISLVDAVDDQSVLMDPITEILPLLHRIECRIAVCALADLKLLRLAGATGPSARLADGQKAWLVDGCYPGHEQLNAAAEQTTVYAPVPKAKKDKESDPHVPKASDSKAVAAWRERMGTEEAKIIYRDRAATAECVNAQARNRGLIRLPVRGTTKVKAVALLFALAHNLMRIAALVPEWMGIGTGPSGVASSIG